MAAVVRQHQEIEAELLAVEREQEDADEQQNGGTIKLSPRITPGAGQSKLTYRVSSTDVEEAQKSCRTNEEAGVQIQKELRQKAQLTIPRQPGHHVQPGHHTWQGRVQQPDDDSYASATPGSHPRNNDRHADDSASQLPPQSSSGQTRTGGTKQLPLSDGGAGTSGGRGVGGGAGGAGMKTVRRRSMIRMLLDRRIGGGGSGSPMVEKRWRNPERSNSQGTTAPSGQGPLDESQSSHMSDSSAQDHTGSTFSGDNREGRIRTASDTSTGSMQMVTRKKVGRIEDDDEVDEVDEGAIRGQNVVVGQGESATAFLRLTFRAYVRCLQTEIEEREATRRRRKLRKLARRQKQILESRREVSNVVSVGASTVGRLMAPPPAGIQGTGDTNFPETMQGVSSGDDSDGFDSDGNVGQMGVMERAFARNEADHAAWNEKTAAFAWVLPARVVAEEIIQRASSGAAISQTDLFFAKVMAVVVLLLPGIVFLLPGGAETTEDDVAMWQRLVVFVVVCAGTYNLNFVNFRFLIRLVARARRKRSLMNSISCMLDYACSMDARIPFVDVRLPRNVRAWAAIVDVIQMYDRYDSVNAEAPMNAFLAQSTLLMFILAVAAVLVAAQVIAVELSTFIVMVAYLILSAIGSIFTLYLEAGTNFRLLKVSQRLAHLRSKMQADLVNTVAINGRINGLGMPVGSFKGTCTEVGSRGSSLGYIGTEDEKEHGIWRQGAGQSSPYVTGESRGNSLHGLKGYSAGERPHAGSNVHFHTVRQPSGVTQGAYSVRFGSISDDATNVKNAHGAGSWNGGGKQSHHNGAGSWNGGGKQSHHNGAGSGSASASASQPRMSEDKDAAGEMSPYVDLEQGVSEVAMERGSSARKADEAVECIGSRKQGIGSSSCRGGPRNSDISDVGRTSGNSSGTRREEGGGVRFADRVVEAQVEACVVGQNEGELPPGAVRRQDRQRQGQVQESQKGGFGTHGIRSQSSSHAMQMSLNLNAQPNRRVRIVSAGDALTDSGMSSSSTPVMGDRNQSSGTSVASNTEGGSHGDTGVVRAFHGSSGSSRSGSGSGSGGLSIVGQLRAVAGPAASAPLVGGGTQLPAAGWGDGLELPSDGGTGQRGTPPIQVPHGPLIGAGSPSLRGRTKGVYHEQENSDGLRRRHRVDSVRNEHAALKQMLQASVDLVEARTIEIQLGGMYTRLFGGVVIDFALLRGIVGVISGAALSVITLLLQDSKSLLTNVG